MELLTSEQQYLDVATYVRYLPREDQVNTYARFLRCLECDAPALSTPVTTQEADAYYKQMRAACLDVAREQQIDVLAVARVVVEQPETRLRMVQRKHGMPTDSYPITLDDEALFGSWDLSISEVFHHLKKLVEPTNMYNSTYVLYRYTNCILRV